MKRIMIVDDEALVRMGIKSLLDWEKHGYEVVCDASSGQEALEKIETYCPDIILTDLKMEPGDGFWLICQCRRRYPAIVFVVLSNYNDFDNVRKAMKLGASDYVFKLTIKPDEMLKILEDVSRNLKPTEDSSGSKALKKNLESIKTGILEKLLDPNPALPFKMEELFADIPLKVCLDESYRAVFLRIDHYKILSLRGDFPKKDLLRFTMENIIDEVFNRSNRADVFFWKDGYYAVLANVANDDMELLNKEFHMLVNGVRRVLGVSVSGAVSRDYCGMAMAGAAVQESAAILNQVFYKSENLYQRTLDKTGLEKELQEKETEKCRQLLEQGNIMGALNFFEEMLALIEKKKPLLRSDVTHFLKKLYRLLYVYCQKAGFDLDQITDKNGADFNAVIEGYDYYRDLENALAELIEKYRHLCSGQGEKRVRREIRQILQYVSENLMRDISVADAAQLVNMSESRFAHLFKEETGTSFGEYINRQRMNQAAWLLNQTDLRVNEIAERIGVDNSNYFSAQFKKVFGKSPMEYRRGEKEKME